MSTSRISVLFVVLALALVACSGSSEEGSAPATTEATSAPDDQAESDTTSAPVAEPAELPDGAAVLVGDTTLSESELDAFLTEWAQLNSGEPTITPEVKASGLEFWVQVTALTEELVDDITDEDRAEGAAWIADVVPTLESGTLLHDTVTLWWATRLVVGRESGIDTVVTDQQLRDRLDEINADIPAGVCSSHVLVDTQAEADAVRARIEAGEEFAAVAAEVSTDPGSGTNGGSLGCVPEGSFVEPFENAVWAAEEGDLIGPVETEFGFHVILHEGFDREQFEFEDTKDELRQAVIDERFQEIDEDHETRAVDAARQAPVAVAETVGVWNQDGANLTPA